MSNVALITGITGQDGSYLAEYLLKKGYEIHGMIRRTALHPDSMKNIQPIENEITIHFGDMTHESQICYLLQSLQPNELYNLAAQSDVRVSFDIPEYTQNVTSIGVTRLLEAVRKFSPRTKMYQAGSSEMFGSSPPPQNELTPFRPRSPYGVAKYAAHCMTQIYREGYGIFVSNGILFNHESPKRGKNFVTKKITSAVNEIVRGERKELFLGNLEGKRDWGYAPDYVQAMWLMLQETEPDDYVIGTGETHTVGEFVKEAFSLVNLDWERYVKIDQNLYRPVEVDYLLADASKAREKLGWSPSVAFKELVKIMMEE